MSIPEGLRDVIGRRLSLLSPECNQLLSVASVIGREFALETLKAVAGIDEDVFVNALGEAVRLSVLEERSQVGLVRYRFTHAFFRQTLYEEMIAPQRLKLHQQVARSLETLYAKRLEGHAAELAEQFSYSTDPADLKKAVEYAEMAARKATEVYAYGEGGKAAGACAQGTGDTGLRGQGQTLRPGPGSDRCFAYGRRASTGCRDRGAPGAVPG